ncbi:hypothetical protein NC653_040194 [Populus alba x Populus x berolinensis]|uniref:Uncharacterized protein n=1 Tax=Populus alba x Populus x berolinensis TaxID=444605 RepID=A0AAD6LD93_9ROSI|nr:hypothetical protein NC653_040194 [Populus alba x Populus x berolinensis]
MSTLCKLHQNLASLKFPWLGSQLFAPSANSSSYFCRAMRIVAAKRVAEQALILCEGEISSSMEKDKETVTVEEEGFSLELPAPSGWKKKVPF